MSLRTKQINALNNLLTKSDDKRLAFFGPEDTDKLNNRNILTKEDVERIVDFKPVYNSGLEGLLEVNGKNLDKSKPICIDLETEGVDPYEHAIKVVGLSNGERHLYCDEPDKFGELLGYLNDFYKLFAYQVQFEHKFIYLNYGLDIEFCDDPMIQAHLIWNYTNADLKLSRLANQWLGRFPKSLEEISGRKFTPSDPFDWQRDAEPYLEEVATYCCEDCYETVLLRDLFYEQFKNRNLRKLKGLYLNVDLPSALICSKMSLRGVRIDRNELPIMEQDINRYVEILQEEIEDSVGWYANPKSSPQMQKLFYEQLEADTSEIRATQKGYSVDAKSRQTLQKQGGKVGVIARKYDYITRCQDLLSKYVKPAYNWIKQDGKVHANFNVCKTATGRLSSDNPNLQNIPNPEKYKSLGEEFLAELGQRVRDLFIADPEHVLIACDYSSFELKILAHLSGDETLIDTFNRGLSLHDVVTEKLFGIFYDPNNPDHKAKRTLCKTINFGLIYGMTWKRLYEECKQRRMNWSQDDCKRIIDEYWATLPTLASWFERTKFEAIFKGYTETIFGRRRYYQFSEDCVSMATRVYSIEELEKYITPNDAEMLRQAGNAVIQGSNADAIRIAMKKCEPEPLISTILQVHDELVFQVHKDKADLAMEKVKEIMEGAITLDVPVEAEPKKALTWGHCK